jgi:hypothetical protein
MGVEGHSVNGGTGDDNHSVGLVTAGRAGLVVRL